MIQTLFVGTVWSTNSTRRIKTVPASPFLTSSVNLAPFMKQGRLLGPLHNGLVSREPRKDDQ